MNKEADAMKLLDRTRSDQRKLLRVLRALGVDAYWQASSATIPIALPESKHHVNIYLNNRQVYLWGISGLIFHPGRVPSDITHRMIRRNTRLAGIQWTTCVACGREMFAVSAAVHIRQLTATKLNELLSSVVQELERCRLVLEFGRTSSK